MINRFSQYLVEEERIVYFTFGRMNPPTIGHGKLMDALAAKAGRNPYFIYLSQSNNAKKDPIPYKDKVKHVRKMFPKHGRQIVINKKVITPFFALSDLYSKGYRKVVMVAGSDRVQEYDLRLNKYNGKKGAHGFYNFEDGIKIINAGARDPDAEGAEGASGTKQRKYASDGNFSKFAQGLPPSMSNKDARKLYNDVRKGMGLKESNDFKRHVQLEPVSETREAFVKGELFELGQTVIIEKSGEVGKIEIIGSNYVIVEANGKRTRQWLDSVSSVSEEYKYEWGTDASARHARKMTPGQSELKTPQDKDIADRPGTQPSRYHKGLSKATKAVRDRQFKKQSKMADDNPAAYKDAPGDKQARKKDMPLSKHTKFVHNMMGESLDRVRDRNAQDRERVADKHRKEKEAMKVAHDRRVDRARRQATMQKNQGMDEASFADKSKASGISTGTLKKVYNRGVAAWKTGHRPGTTPSQWGHARVNAFIRKKKQGGLNHDKDLA